MTDVLVDIGELRFQYDDESRKHGKSDSLALLDGAQILAGRLTSVRGPNASGKSTLLGILAGELPHIWGGHMCGGVTWSRRLCDAGGNTPDIRAIGALLRGPEEMFSGFLDTIYDELCFPLLARGLTHAEAERAIEPVVRGLQLESLLGRNPLALSGGERQRIVLGLASVTSPRLLVLDDPTAHLDATAHELVESYLAELSSMGTGVVIEDRAPEPTSPTIVALTHAAVPVQPTVVPSAFAPATQAGKLSVQLRSAGYGDKPQLHDIAFEAFAGDCVVVRGRNGAGKSTLLRALSGVLPQCDGEIVVDGRRLDGIKPHRRCQTFAYALQDPSHQTFTTSVRDELLAVLRFGSRGDKADRTRHTNELAESLRLLSLLDRHPRELARSELRWLGVASAMMLRAPILLLDEPTVGLDEDGVSLLTAVVRAHQQVGGIVIVASHDSAWAERVATHCLVVVPSRVGGPHTISEVACLPRSQAFGSRSAGP